MSRAQEVAVQKFQLAAAKRMTAKREYDRALRECVDAGVSNTLMASVAGVSEAAIRMYRKRNNIRRNC